MEQSLHGFMENLSPGDRMLWFAIFSDVCNEDISPEDVIDTVEKHFSSNILEVEA